MSALVPFPLRPGISLWHRLVRPPGGAVSESGTLRHGDGTHGRSDRCRRSFVLPILPTRGHEGRQLLPTPMQIRRYASESIGAKVNLQPDSACGGVLSCPLGLILRQRKKVTGLFIRSLPSRNGSHGTLPENSLMCVLKPQGTDSFPTWTSPLACSHPRHTLSELPCRRTSLWP
jgi:hypothetical protein